MVYHSSSEIATGNFRYGTNGNGFLAIYYSVRLSFRLLLTPLQFFLTGRQGQLGVEGFALGSLYLVVSCSIAFITFLAPRISHRWLRDTLSVIGAMLAAGSVYQTFMLWTMKMGYRHVLYI